MHTTEKMQTNCYAAQIAYLSISLVLRKQRYLCRSKQKKKASFISRSLVIVYVRETISVELKSSTKAKSAQNLLKADLDNQPTPCYFSQVLGKEDGFKWTELHEKKTPEIFDDADLSCWNEKAFA